MPLKGESVFLVLLASFIGLLWPQEAPSRAIVEPPARDIAVGDTPRDPGLKHLPLAAEKEILAWRARLDKVRCLKVITSLDDTWFDLNKIDQVITNLLTNAVKYSYQNTTTVVAIMKDLKKARLVVKDQGQGIPSNEIIKLFKPFAKTSVKSTGGEKSTGLGLMIVKKIVDGHGGTITVESEVGAGTTFTVELPLAEE